MQQQFGQQYFFPGRGGYMGGFQPGGYSPQPYSHPSQNGYYPQYGAHPYIQPAYPMYNGAMQPIPEYVRVGRGINYSAGRAMGYRRGMPYQTGFARGGRGTFGMTQRRKKPFVGGSLETQRQWERSTMCCFFLQGECKFGEGCRFLHESDDARPCQFGSQCRVGHANRTDGDAAATAKAAAAAEKPTEPVTATPKSAEPEAVPADRAKGKAESDKTDTSMPNTDELTANTGGAPKKEVNDAHKPEKTTSTATAE